MDVNILLMGGPFDGTWLAHKSFSNQQVLELALPTMNAETLFAAETEVTAPSLTKHVYFNSGDIHPIQTERSKEIVVFTFKEKLSFDKILSNLLNGYRRPKEI